ncbi:phosphatidylglycerophosphatase [Bibersteinia trehalosi Y31]|uniref:Phosphatidylglycerophosphatase A n=1 Tax=Bibersteinia trehalosi Y31 TaxID=1261658 RepID=A0A179CX48_BIBTR|nr:phosphatidylglycerophosphatase A [Bibersteinia trehalosi]OAQ14372.1 phosphatidylglycerophosphatase [Bibersteinia trehalosi Y31]
MMNINLKNPLHFLALGFGSGLLKPAPGTWGSLAGLLLSILLWEISESVVFFILLSIVAFIAGIYICEKMSYELGVHDDSRIVWDEIAAIFLIFVGLPQHDLFYYLLTFATFRLFDIIKPFPIRNIDAHLQGGLGIMLDDTLAAIYALLAIYLVYWIF